MKPERQGHINCKCIMTPLYRLPAKKKHSHGIIGIKVSDSGELSLKIEK